jgi:hypothetical protein
MAEIVNISYIGSGTETQVYTPKDDSLITNSFIYTQFGDQNDGIEYFIYDANGILLDKVYNATDYTPASPVNATTGLYDSINLDPKKDLESRGFNRGTLDIQYNFLRNLFSSAYGRFYWIKEVSTSRTEIKLASQDISNTDILSGFNQYQAYIAGLSYYNDFYLNFGNNQHIIAVNVAYTEDADGAYLLIKLYEPLPSDFDVKDQLWISEKIAESTRYNVNIEVEAAVISAQQNALRGPNFEVDINQQVGQITPYYSYNTLSTTSVSSSFQKMMSYYQDRALEINVDYTDFSNFIHFSSATSRLQNFANKVANIENYKNLITSQSAITGGPTNPVISSSILLLNNQIDSIITNFDTFEYYLYFSSGSYTWPKSNSTQPYSLYSVTSSVAKTWLTSSLESAAYYDSTNKDLLVNTIPQYIQDDSANTPYITFVNMIGQHFDNIWIYYKDVTNRFDATNNPETGISPDLVADALMALGSTLYTNSNISDNLYYSLFGINQNGSLLPPTGSEKITNYVTSSLTTLSPKQIQSEIYKRIYHNIPYLYKTKGTRNSIDAIVNIFGIPKSILTINEFGGYDRSSISGLDSIYNTKISGSTSTVEISSSLLHPDVTLQYYSTQDRSNSKNVEFGFSPADALNSVITSSGYINIDQLIGDPNAQYSSSYQALNEYENDFFAGYNYTHSIVEYVRLLKYFDNSIFKMVKDYVPARSSLSSGMIVKSHILERNKYERHEPEMDNSMNYSQSVETIEISGGDPASISGSTAYNSFSQYTVVSPYIATGSDNVYGPVAVSNTYSWEKYTGEFGGSEIEMVTDEFSQLERSSITSPWTSSVATTQSMFTFYNEGALVNNFVNQQKSKEFVEAEYSYGANMPINFANIASQSVCQTCERFPCFTYYIQNNGTDTAFIYQGCDDSYATITIASASVASICAKYNSINDTTPTDYTASIIGICGYTYANSKENYNLCYSTTIAVGPSDDVILSYQDCTGSIISGTYTAATSYILGCTKENSIIVSASSLSSDYTASYGGICGIFGDCRSISAFNSAASLPITASYQNCNGVAITSSIEAGDSLDFGCIKYSTLYTASYGTFILTDNGYCVNANKCTYIPLITVGPGEYGLNYLRCNGENILITGSVSPMSVAVNLDDCVRYNSIITYGNVGITPGGECGYYEDIAEYTGSRDYAEIQDYNYYRTSAVHSKYAGAKYSNSNASENWSFGAAYQPRDYYVDYTGLFTEIQSSSYDPNQMVVKLPYLANISGGLQELNLQNDNWTYFQTMYKSGTNVTLKQFNSTQYSNQKYLDKTFKIVESGYSYQPYWYRKAGETDECYETIFGGDSYLSGSKAEIDLNIISPNNANNEIAAGLYGSPHSFATIHSGSAISSSWIWHNTSLDISAPPAVLSVGSKIYDPNSRFTTYSSGSGALSGSYYTVPYNGIYNIIGGIGWNMTILESPYLTYSFKVKVDILKNASYSTGFLEGEVIATYTDEISAAVNGSSSVGLGTEFYGGTYTVALNKPLAATNTIWVKVSILTSYPDIQLFGTTGYFSVESVPFSGMYCINPNDTVYKLFNTSSFTIGSNTLTISSGMNGFFLDGTTYAPYYTSGSITESPLYSTFGDVTYDTKIKAGDYIYLYYNGDSIGYPDGGISSPILRRITSITTGSITSSFTVYPELPGYLTSTNINSYDKIVFTKRVPDETTMILQGKKNPGKTSYGFAIPENINPTITKNINTLQSTIQSQILNF